VPPANDQQRVQALAADTGDLAFGPGIRIWRPHRSPDHLRAWLPAGSSGRNSPANPVAPTQASHANLTAGAASSGLPGPGRESRVARRVYSAGRPGPVRPLHRRHFRLASNFVAAIPGGPSCTPSRLRADAGLLQRPPQTTTVASRTGGRSLPMVKVYGSRCAGTRGP
jgi:hypothetical protein